MKFLFAANTPRDPNAGASGCDIATIEALRSQGHDVDEIWAEDMPRRIQHPNLHQLLELPRRFASVVASKCRSNRYDVIQVNQPHAWRVAKQHRRSHAPGLFLNRSHGWETALHLALKRLKIADRRSIGRQLVSGLLRFGLERHNAWVTRWSDGLVVCSEADKRFISDHYRISSERIHVFVPGVPDDFLRCSVSPDTSRWQRVLHVSNFCAPKAPELVAAVYKMIVVRHPQAELTWVCSAKDHVAVRELLGEVSPRVSICDFMPRAELMKEMDRHGVFLFPSHYEGFGMVFLEAMTRGMCVVGTPVGGMPSCITSGFNGLLVDAGDGDQVVEAASRLLRNESESARLGNNARLTAQEFSWEKAAREYVAFCDSTQRLRMCVN